MMQIPSCLRAAAADIRLAFFDIDGTLLDSQGQIKQELYTAIGLLKRRGIRTAIASGRPYFAAKYLIDELGINNAGMFYTGAHLFDPLNQQTLYETPLARDSALAVVNAASELGLYVEVYTADAFFVADVVPITEVHAKHLRVQLIRADLSNLIQTQSISKLLLGVNRVEQGDLLPLLEQRFPQEIFARAYLSAYPDWQFASVISGQATKQSAFQTLLTHHQLEAHQVLAFGDAESDMDFLRMAGIGVAMGNANKNVQASANWVTKTADEAGVAFAIHQLFGN
jgi:5-amino-6-(5-phospho-D-ribitylamino)uracil phosphatase